MTFRKTCASQKLSWRQRKMSSVGWVLFQLFYLVNSSVMLIWGSNSGLPHQKEKRSIYIILIFLVRVRHLLGVEWSDCHLLTGLPNKQTVCSQRSVNIPSFIRLWGLFINGDVWGKLQEDAAAWIWLPCHHLVPILRILDWLSLSFHI